MVENIIVVGRPLNPKGFSIEDVFKNKDVSEAFNSINTEDKILNEPGKIIVPYENEQTEIAKES